ncbi:C2H2 type domain-containing protein [Hexamita inflata]|uniref:C2H2 type domain-containing protein n=1 Tax=Hexamita inflata TaxID=28002 RepID=A0AA86N555_9EUKA|nr:C2H2 type domain-containing protein [Hexamita inflata]
MSEPQEIAPPKEEQEPTVPQQVQQQDPEIQQVKRGRGRPKKIVDPNAEPVVKEKKPRKPRAKKEVAEVLQEALDDEDDEKPNVVVDDSENENESLYAGSDNSDDDDDGSNKKYRYKCETCGKLYDRSNHYKKHMASHGLSTEVDDGDFTCQFCRQSFQTQQILNMHTCKLTDDVDLDQPINLNMQGSYACTKCDKQFTQRYHLRVHNMMHTGDKPHQCPICGKGFARKDVMKVHLLVHNEECDHACEVCGRKFKQKFHLTRHMNTHLEQQDIVCDFCGQIFNRLDRYNQHIKRAHIGKE